LLVDSIGSNTLGTSGTVDVNITDFREGGTSGDTQYGYFRIDDADLDPGFPLKGGVTTSQFSVAFWMKARTGSTQVTGAGLFTKGAEKTSPYTHSFAIGLYESGGAGTGAIVLNVGTSDGTNQYKYLAGLDRYIQREQWYHLAVTYQETSATTQTLKLYVYDPSDDTVTTWTKDSAKIPVFDGPLALGTIIWHTSRFDGLLDEVVVFKDVLTATEVNQIRQGTYGKP